MKFTGHERDLANTASAADDLDYMHARFYNPQTGRFLSTDPVDSAAGQAPQSWNKYAYVRGNPLKFVDPDGEALDLALDIGFIGYDLFDIGRSLVKGEGVSGTQLAALGADVAATFIPVVTGAGAVVRAGRAADRVIDVQRTAASFARVEGRAEILTKVIQPDGSLKVTDTVAKQLAGTAPGKDRSFIPTQAILETIGSGAKSADPAGAKGFSLFKSNVTFNGSKGVLEVLVDEKTGRVAHVLFKSGKKAAK